MLFYSEAFGFESYKRYNLHLLEEDTIIFISGISYNILNLTTFERKHFFTKDGGGLGSIAVSIKKMEYGFKTLVLFKTFSGSSFENILCRG